MNLQKGFFRLWVIGSVCWLAFLMWQLYWEHRSIKMDAWWIMNDTLKICEKLPAKSIAKRPSVIAEDEWRMGDYFSNFRIDKNYILLYTCMDKPISETTTEEQLDHIHKIQSKYATKYMLNQPYPNSILSRLLLLIVPPLLVMFLFMIIQWVLRGFKK
jgi:hypothetical protein|tara:strand:+ start:226 stop:699 length:474 start_codon:yes stop_codon:yes gene_type:complete